MTKAGKRLVVLFMAGAVVFGGFFAQDTLASQDAEKQVAKAVNGYASAIKNGDADKMMKYSIDTRVKEESQMKLKYDKYAKKYKESHTNVDIVSINNIDDERFEATFELSSDEHKKPFQFTLPVIKDGSGWKMFVDGSVVAGNQGK